MQTDAGTFPQKMATSVEHANKPLQSPESYVLCTLGLSAEDLQWDIGRKVNIPADMEGHGGDLDKT